MSISEIALLTAAGLMVGFINTLAGGGSIISLSILMALGLPPTLANGTNRVGIIIQTITATTSFRQQKVLETRKAIKLAIPATIGSVIGAFVAVDINEDIFKKAIGVTMLIMLVFIFYNPKKYIYGNVQIENKPFTWKTYLIFFLIGIYGGFIHMGVGYFLLTAIVMGAGFDLVKANAIKVFVVLAYIPFSLVVFIYYGQVNWLYGFIVAIGSVSGAFIASRMAVSKGVDFIKWVIVVVILLTSGQMFGLYDLKGLIG